MKTGDLYNYHARNGEDNSFVRVGIVDDRGVHLSIVGINMLVPDPRDTAGLRKARCPVIGHMYISTAAFHHSVIAVFDPDQPNEKARIGEVMKMAKLNQKSFEALFTQGYESWLKKGEPAPMEWEVATFVTRLEEGFNSSKKVAIKV